MSCIKCLCEDCVNKYNYIRLHKYHDDITGVIARGLDFGAPRNQWEWRYCRDILCSLGIEDTHSNLVKAGKYIMQNNGGIKRRSNGRTLIACPPLRQPSKPAKEETL